MKQGQHIHPQAHKIARVDRSSLNGHPSFVIWFTGLSGSGKSTLAGMLEQHLHQRDIHTYLLDGDNLRSGLNKDLGFSAADRKENIRRVGEVANLFADAGMVVLASFITPFREDRRWLRELMGEENFVEVHVDAPLESCEGRDVKGLYQKARLGIIKDFTGIDSPFEVPVNPEIRVATAENSPEECISEIIKFIDQKYKL